MSDYLFKLESHLTPAQREVVIAVSAAAENEGQTFLVGGAMRDMLGGFPIGDLDFAVQGNALALAKAVVRNTGAEVVETDTRRKSVELRFPGGVPAEIGMARTETFPKAGGQPRVKPSSIHEDLLRRDFTINAIALSLHPASRGLLLDPSNGLADLDRRELRANGNYGFYDDPIRLLRLIRYRVRFGFEVQERTRQQYENAREARMETRIPVRSLFGELRSIAEEINGGEILAELSREKLVHLFSPALVGSKLNLAGLAKLEKVRQMIPFGVNLQLRNLGLFLDVLTQKLTPREKTDLAKRLVMEKSEVELWHGLPGRTRKLERDLKSGKLKRTSEIFLRLRETPGEEILYLYLNSKERIVHDRIRNFLQKHLYAATEVTDRDVATLAGVEPGHPDVPAMKEELILAQLDGRKWKPPAHLLKKAEPPRRSSKRAKKAQKKAAPKSAEAAAKTTKAKPAKKIEDPPKTASPKQEVGKSAKTVPKAASKPAPKKTASNPAPKKAAAQKKAVPATGKPAQEKKAGPAQGKTTPAKKAAKARKTVAGAAGKTARKRK